MGNCHKDSPDDPEFSNKIFESIKKYSSYRLSSLVQLYLQSSDLKSLDELKHKHNNITTNPLGLCLLLNKPDHFSKLLSINCSVSAMEQVFMLSSFNSLEYLIQQNFISVLKVYFPLYLDLNKKANCSTNSYSITFNSSFKYRPRVLPIHLAAILGHLEIVSYFCTFFKDKLISLDYDVESLEENTGENSALLACRYGHYQLVTYLHTQTDADFTILNSFKENALIVTLASMNKDPSCKFIEIFRYLLDEVKLDPRYKQEDLLLLAKSKPMRNILLQNLRKIGVVIEGTDENDLSFTYSNPNDSTREPPKNVFTDSFIKQEPQGYEIRSIPSSICQETDGYDIRNSILF